MISPLRWLRRRLTQSYWWHRNICAFDPPSRIFGMRIGSKRIIAYEAEHDKQVVEWLVAMSRYNTASPAPTAQRKTK